MKASAIIAALLLPQLAFAQLKAEVQYEASASTSSAVQSLWSYSQEWGRYSQYQQGETGLYASLGYSFKPVSWFSANVGTSLQASTDHQRTTLHEAFLSGKLLIFDYTFGREARTPIEQHSNLGLGTFLMSANAAPYTRAGAGIFDYWSHPGLGRWVEVKGGLYYGVLPDSTSRTLSDNVLIHEKFAYMRIGRFCVKPYLGLLHSVLMGGIDPYSGKKIPVDVVASFYAGSSDKMLENGFGGEYYNAAGGHSGMWDLGLDFDFEPVGGSLYYQRPFGDKTAINLLDFKKCKDHVLGAYVRLKHFRPVSEVNLEYMTTIWQGGNGPSDPNFISTGPELTGQAVCVPWNSLDENAIRSYFSQDIIDEWESAHGPLGPGSYHAFMVHYANKDWPSGNRTPYLENYLYPQGWTVGDLAMGYPVFLTSTTMSRIAPNYEFVKRFSNVRLWAVSLGACGQISETLDWKAKLTFTDNYGTLREQYYEGTEFDILRPNYYFTTSKKQVYSGLWLNCHLGRITLGSMLGLDFGQMYNALSARISLRYALEK